jgi:hypothetical protein
MKKYPLPPYQVISKLKKKMLLTTPIISHIVQEDSDVSEDYMSQNPSDETHWALKKLDVMHQAYKAAA